MPWRLGGGRLGPVDVDENMCTKGGNYSLPAMAGAAGVFFEIITAVKFTVNIINCLLCVLGKPREPGVHWLFFSCYVYLKKRRYKCAHSLFRASNF